MDEAGYGPRIGPLVIAATLWKTPCHSGEITPDLINELVEGAIGRHPTSDFAPIYVDDSKRLYHSPNDLGRLEQAVLPLLRLAGWQGSSVRELIAYLDPAAVHLCDQLPWLQDYNAELPRQLPSADLQSRLSRLAEKLRAVGVEAARCTAAVVFEPQLNYRLAVMQNKASVLWEIALELLLRLVEQAGLSEVWVFADRQGGRLYYGSLLAEAKQKELICGWMVQQEDPSASSYQVFGKGSKWHLTFLRKGERYVPIAAASMLAKYARELVMEAFNQFWCSQIPGLRPTAGYPVDAARFVREIAQLQTRLGLPRELFWRAK